MQHYILSTETDITELLDYVDTNNFDMVAFDIETDSVEEIKANVYGIGLAFQDDEAFYIPLRSKDGSGVFSNEVGVVKLLCSLLEGRKVIGHNIIYDVLVMKHRYGIDLTPHVYADTILMKHSINEEPPHGLKETAVKYLGDWANKAELALYENIEANGGSTTKTNLQMYKADTEVLGEYCAWDVMLTFKLFNLFQPKLEQEGLTKLFYEDEVMPLYKEVTIPMKYNGVAINVELLQQKQLEINKVSAELQTKILTTINPIIKRYELNRLNEKAPIKNKGIYPEFLAQVLKEELPTSLAKKVLEKHSNLITVQWMLGLTEVAPIILEKAQRLMYAHKHNGQLTAFNISSKDDLKWLFFHALKEKALSKTDGGDDRVDDEFLLSIEHKYDFVKDIRDYNVLQKISGTYIDGVLERIVDGRLYTSFLQFGTTSGRFASRNPNLQNWPAPQKTGGITDEFVNCIRHAIIPSKDCRLIGADFSSLEPHIAAYVSGDGGLIDIFVTNKDFYSAIAIKQFNLSEYSPYKEDKNYLGNMDKALRDLTKTYSLASFYGATGARISQVLKCSIEKAENLLSGYMKAFPGIESFIKNTHTQAVKLGYVKTIFGRVRHLSRCRELYLQYGMNLLDAKWARSRALYEERAEFRNLLNNAVNFQIQGTAGHIMNRAMLKTAREFKKHGIKGYIAMTIHDEQLINVSQEHVELASKLVKDAMESAVTLGPIKLKATPVVGDSYGQCK